MTTKKHSQLGKKYRHDINLSEERKIKNAIKKGESVLSLSTRYQCSEGLIRQIRDGCRVRPPKPIPETIPPDQLCTCCGRKPKGEGNRFLCDDCFSNAGGDPLLDNVHGCPTMSRITGARQSKS